MRPSSAAVERDPSSFRDHRGFVYRQDGQVYRRINAAGLAAYDRLMTSGLYEDLTRRGLLVRHEEVTAGPGLKGAVPGEAGAYRVIRPELVEVITYPYEWAFSQLRDAALATLTIQKRALAHGMSLRDASAYNVQLVRGRMCLIDTLSFDEYRPGEPWAAYRQFCQHFVAPLAVMSRVDAGLGQLLRVHLDGIPLGLAAKLLPWRDRLRPGLATHISLHARFQQRHEGTGRRAAAAVGPAALQGLVDSLERTVRGLRLGTARTQWGDYYAHTNYSAAAARHKRETVAEWLGRMRPARVLDLGSNDGAFSRIAAEGGAAVISCDVDPLAVEHNYRQVKRGREERLWPVLADLTNPSPALGWAGRERSALGERVRADVALALALVHHLAIAGNVPLEMVAAYFAELAPELIVEFVPKEDSQVQRLLATREDVFADYTVSGFEAAFGAHYEVVERRDVADSARRLYWIRRRKGAA